VVVDMESVQLNLVMDMVMEVLPVVRVVMDMVDMANVQLNLHLLNMDMVKDQQSLAMEVDSAPEATEVDTAPEASEVDTAPEATEVDTAPEASEVDTAPEATDTMDRLCGFTRREELDSTLMFVINQV